MGTRHGHFSTSPHCLSPHSLTAGWLTTAVKLRVPTPGVATGTVPFDKMSCNEWQETTVTVPPMPSTDRRRRQWLDYPIPIFYLRWNNELTEGTWITQHPQTGDVDAFGGDQDQLSNTEVKTRRLRLVLGWVTTGKDQALMRTWVRSSACAIICDRSSIGLWPLSYLHGRKTNITKPIANSSCSAGACWRLGIQRRAATRQEYMSNLSRYLRTPWLFRQSGDEVRHGTRVSSKAENYISGAE